jgi:hypothetical protein
LPIMSYPQIRTDRAVFTLPHHKRAALNSSLLTSSFFGLEWRLVSTVVALSQTIFLARFPSSL